MYDRSIGHLLGNREIVMEYALYSVYYFFQSLFNITMHMDVADDVSIGSIIIAIMILSVVFASFGFMTNLLKKEERDSKKNKKG